MVSSIYAFGASSGHYCIGNNIWKGIMLLINVQNIKNKAQL